MGVANYSKNGTIEGELANMPETVSCGIICSGWPGWGLAVKVRNWTIKIIIIKNNFWIREIKSFLPNACILSYDECEKWLGLGLDIDFWLSDIDPPRKLSLFNSNTQATIVTCRGR
jgi:hypothetical protein